MHEPSIAAALIELVQKELEQSGCPQGPVTGLVVRIGALRGVVEDSLKFAFATLRHGTPLDHAELVIENVPVRGRCRRCAELFQPLQPIFICAHCGSGDLDVQAGNELDLVSFTIEDEN